MIEGSGNYKKLEKVIHAIAELQEIIDQLILENQRLNAKIIGIEQHLKINALRKYHTVNRTKIHDTKRKGTLRLTHRNDKKA